MIERDLDVPAGIDAVRAVGTLTRRDYDDVVVPLLDAAAREHRRLRILVTVDDAFTGMTPGAMWDDLRLGLGALGRLAACAVVTDLPWARRSLRLTTFFLPARIRVFGEGERAAALAWLDDLPAPLADVTLRADQGIVVAEIDQPVRREDVNRILTEVDDWLATHAELPGLVLRAPAFPGWENLYALLHHLHFVAGHQGRIRRVALVVPGSGVAVAAGIVGTVLHPEVAQFADLEAAVSWVAVAAERVG